MSHPIYFISGRYIMKMEEFKTALNNARSDMNKNQLNDRINEMLLDLHDNLDEHRGEDNSLDIVREELAEMIQAVSKMIRFGEEDDWYHLLEEYADVLIALDVVKHRYHFEKSEIENAKYVKLNRLMKKIQEKGYIV